MLKFSVYITLDKVSKRFFFFSFSFFPGDGSFANVINRDAGGKKKEEWDDEEEEEEVRSFEVPLGPKPPPPLRPPRSLKSLKGADVWEFVGGVGSGLKTGGVAGDGAVEVDALTDAIFVRGGCSV